MPTVLITGANRGLGLEFARQYSREGWDVIATAREPAPELDELGARVERVDMADLDGVAGLGKRIDALDLLIANAGTYGPQDVNDAEQARGWSETFIVNTIAPFLVAKAVLPAIEASHGKLIAYRTSKTALNSAWHNLAIECRGRGVVAAVLHPGWVQTRMGGSSAPLQPDESVAGMRHVIDRLGPDDSGGFFGYDGARIPW
jgi:NAD(P)-dependent dehydrogenase (short-subunit alcohol dehydrogenase family)